jgi:acetolactate synthase-1/2/3 large subunit
MTKLFSQLEEDDAIITGNGSACVCSFQAAIIKRNQRLFTNSGCASMGYGLPAALGVAVARKGERVICLDGDGSIQMNLQELQTIVHNHLDIKIFWLNNDGYHSIRQTQKNLFEPPMYGVSKENGISFPEAERIAYAYSLPFVKINTLLDIDKKLQETLRKLGPVIIEVVLDPEQSFAPKLSAKRLPDGSMVSPPLDDMYPFLSDAEMNAIKQEIESL